MSQDTLSEVLRAVRLHGAVFYYVDGSSPWVAEAPPAKEIVAGIMPGTEHMIEFHGVVKGSCWAAAATARRSPAASWVWTRARSILCWRRSRA